MPGKQLPSDLFEAALAALRPLGITSFVAEEVRTGGTSVCYVVLGLPTGQRLVIKRAAGSADFSAQFDALRAAAHGPGASRRVVPEVYAMFDGGRAVAMEYAEGRSAWDLCASWRFPRGTAAAISGAMREYHRRTGAPFGDFHPRNVILSTDGAVRLIDPAELRPGAGQARLEDLAHWTYSTSASTLDALLWRPWRLLRAVRLNIALLRHATVELAPAERGAFVRSVGGHASARLAGLRRSRWRRDRLAALAGRLTLWWVVGSALRPSVHPNLRGSGDSSDVVGEPQRQRHNAQGHGRGARRRED